MTQPPPDRRAGAQSCLVAQVLPSRHEDGSGYADTAYEQTEQPSDVFGRHHAGVVSLIVNSTLDQRSSQSMHQAHVPGRG